MTIALNTTARPPLALALLATFALGTVACGQDELADEAFGVIDLTPYFSDGGTATNPTAGLPLVIEPKRAKGNGGTIEHYDFGLVKSTKQGGTLVAQANPMYFFFDRSGNPMLAQPTKDERMGHWWITGGDPTYEPNQDPRAVGRSTDLSHSTRPKKVVRDRRRDSTAHQRPITDTLHDGRTYSGLWEIVEVIAPDGYRPDAIKSWQTLKRGVDQKKFKLNPTGVVINCPVLEERQDVIHPLVNHQRAIPRIELWYRRKMGSCLLTTGWEALAHPETLVADAPSKTMESGHWTLRGATVDGGTRPQTMNVRVFVDESGEVGRRLITVPIGRFYTPMSEVRRDDKLLVEARSYNQLIADYDPLVPERYTPVLQHWDFTVPLAPEYNGQFNKASDLDPTIVKERPGTFVRNLAVLGSPDAIPTCGMVETTDPVTRMNQSTCNKAAALASTNCQPLGLTCNPSTCKCDLPTSGFGEYCAPGVRRCRNRDELLTVDESAFAPMGYACHAKRPRGVCYPACNGDATDLTDERDPETGLDVDSRCGYRPGYTCETPTGVPRSSESICVRRCGANDPEELVRKTCGAAERVNLPGKDDFNVSAGLSCLAINGLTACSYNESLEPR